MLSVKGFVLALHLSVVAAAAEPATPVCGTARGADGSALQAGARAELLPVERGYAWELGVLAGRARPEPAAIAGVEGGRYCLAVPEPGVWKVVVGAPGRVAMSRFPVAVTGPVELPPVRLAVDKGVQVTVEPPPGAPASGSWVVAGAADRSFWEGLGGDGWRPDLRVARVDADGRARLPRAPGETLDLRALSPGSLPVTTARAGAATGSVRIALPRPVDRRLLRVVDERGEALGEVTVTLAEHGWPVGVTGEDGSLAVGTAPGEPVPLLLEAEDGRRRVVRLSVAAAAPEGEALRLELPPTPSVHGRIVSGDRRTALPGALVWLAPDPGTHAVAGPDGRFSLPGGGRESLRVEATAAGHLSRALMVAAADLAGGRVQELSLQPAAVALGRVVDRQGRPLGGVEVRVRESGGLPNPAAAERLRERPPDGVSGADGRFSIADVPAGRPLDLLATGRGYLPAWTLKVEPPVAESLTVVLDLASRLSGSLTDPEGVPIPDARVGLRWARPPAGTVGLEPARPPSRSTETDARGAFSFEELTPGDVRLFAQPVGFLPGETETIDLPAGGARTGVRLVLERGAVVAGRISGPAGEPVEGAQLRIDTATALSGADGAFRLAGVPPGTQAVRAFHPSYRRLVREVHVELGENALDLFLEEGWSVTGRTVDEAGRPVAGARLELRPERPGGVTGYRTTSDEDGRFRLVTSEEGTFRLTASHGSFAPGEVGGLEVRTGGIDGIEVTLTRGSSLVGRILGLAADELAGVTVEARREDGVERRPGIDDPLTVRGVVDPLGRYAVDHLTSGTWRVQAELHGGRRRAAATVVLDAGTSEAERDLEFGAGFRLTGRLVYAGEPVSGAHVLLDGLTASGDRSVVSGHDGSFQVEDLAPGRYRLDVLDRTRALSHVQELELHADRDLLLELESAPLVGTVIAADTGEPLEEAMVFVRKAVGASGDAGPLTTVATGATGAFVVAHLTPGDYLVSARKAGYAPAEQTIRVRPGTAPPPALLRLAAAAGVTLTVRLEDGGVPGAATVSAFDPAGRLVVTETRRVSDRGFVHVDQIPPGVWDLLVSAPGAAQAWVRAEVPGGAPEVVLPRGAPLVVRVPALMAADAAGTLAVAGPGGEPFFQVDPVGEVRSRWTVSGGLATLTGFPAGVWTLRVDGAGGGSWVGTAVTDGRVPTQVDLE